MITIFNTLDELNLIKNYEKFNWLSIGLFTSYIPKVGEFLNSSIYSFLVRFQGPLRLGAPVQRTVPSDSYATGSLTESKFKIPIINIYNFKLNIFMKLDISLTFKHPEVFVLFHLHVFAIFKFTDLQLPN